MRDESFAIIGRFPWDDEGHLDGFYYGHELAECMFEYYKQEYPQLDIFLVKLEASEFRCGSRTAKRSVERGSPPDDSPPPVQHKENTAGPLSC